MFRIALSVTTVVAGLALMTTQAVAGHGCDCCGTGGYAYYSGSNGAYVINSQPSTTVATAPSGRVYSYQPGTQAVTAPPVVTAPRAYRSYSYSPSYSGGVRSAAAKPTFNYAPRRGR